MAGISAVSSGMAVALLYVLGRSMWDRTTGLTAALFLASSPWFWFYGEIALPHGLDTLVVIFAVWLFYRIVQGHVELAVPAAIWLGVAGGLRPQTQVFLLPLALYAASRLGWRRRLLALAALMIVDLAWLIPLIRLSGGLSRYLEVTRSFFLAFNVRTSIFSGGGLWGVMRNLGKLGMYASYGWGFASLVGLAAGAKLLRSSSTMAGLWQDVRFRFALIWIFPALAYYTLVHMGQQGLVFVFLPVLLLGSARGISYLVGSLSRGHRLAAAVVILNAALFLIASTFPLGGTKLKLLTLDTLRRHDSYYLSRLEAVRGHFSPQHTALLSTAWRFPEYYLSDYALLPYELGARWEVGEGLPLRESEEWVDASTLGLTADRDGFYYLILFDDGLLPFNLSADRQEWLSLANGESLGYMRFLPQERIYLGPRGYGLVAQDMP